MGLFTDAYDLFCIPPIMRLIGRIYYSEKDYEVPVGVSSPMVALALLGTVIGKLVFGRLGDLFGRRRVYGLALMLMVVSSVGCGFSICTTQQCVLVSLGFFRFLLGVGIGGDYPLSATIMSEFANKRTRGAFIAAVFSMQGLGILMSSGVTMVVCSIFNAVQHPKDTITPKEADMVWRLILMIGAIPAAMTFYWRMMMPETARYTALVEQNVLQAAKNMEKVLDVSLSQIAEDVEFPPNPPPQYPLLSREFFRRHGRDLFSCAASWFLVDIVFYSTNLVQSLINDKFLPPRKDVNAYEDAFAVAKFQALVAVASTIPGYWATVFFIDRIGRVKIQMMGFLFMGLALFASIAAYLHDKSKISFLILYGLTFFFSNFGPNTTTFIVPAELFPARFRSTCHGISGAFGKVGAIIGSVGFLSISHKNQEDKNSDAKMAGALAFLGGVCMLGMIITYLFTRETMGRSLEENEKEDEDEDETQERCFLRIRRRSNSVREVSLSPI
ncbi:Inorganic phosphate transporter 1-9 like [Actinidia chinensis var. chinensis]|uniref:Inorganic phosphate transporter 1-9 like n=1 Tax=Actinidia chinensis var. chinensis TaxID=1590841 RepID=A0A2R6RMA5_ACTCC|nr:Inorganic phosphate transporter 1-9 like [Actinidia chinensis var. chinensis]